MHRKNLRELKAENESLKQRLREMNEEIELLKFFKKEDNESMIFNQTSNPFAKKNPN
jgi:prefoldin subunit 5